MVKSGQVTCLVAVSDLDDGTDVGNSDKPCHFGQGLNPLTMQGIILMPYRFG